MHEQLRPDLALADPLTGDDDARSRDLVQRLATDAKALAMTGTTRTPWWKRRRTMIPLGIVGVVALTGAAVAVPLGLWINGTQVQLDAEIPIVYTTDNGIEVSCRYGIYVGDPATRGEAEEQFADFIKNHDWDGIGQRIYDEAMSNPFVPGPNDDWEVDNQELRDRFSFTRATDLIWQEIPEEMWQSGQSAGATTDCTGRLR